MTELPIFAYPDFDFPFILHTDASAAGLVCGLFQKQDVSIRVISYGSRTLTGFAGQRWLNEMASFNFSIHYKPAAKIM